MSFFQDGNFRPQPEEARRRRIEYHLDVHISTDSEVADIVVVVVELMMFHLVDGVPGIEWRFANDSISAFAERVTFGLCAAKESGGGCEKIPRLGNGHNRHKQHHHTVHFARIGGESSGSTS